MSNRNPEIGDMWSELEFDLSEIRDLLNMRLETKQEAVGVRVSTANRRTGKKAVWRDTTARWADPDIGMSVRAWNVLPYIDAIKQAELQEQIELGKRLVPTIDKCLAAREFSSELLRTWGLLNRVAGAVYLVYRSQSDVGRQREASENLDAHRRWFAHYYRKISPARKREDALEIMESFINSVVRRLPDGEQRQWFDQFLSDKASESLDNARRLTKAFRGKLSAKEIAKLDSEPLNSVPQFALGLPPP